MSLSRVLVGVLAVFLCAAFIVGIRQQHSVDSLTALLGTTDGLSPVEQRAAASDLSAAAFGSPGQDVNILAARVALWERRWRRAESLSLAITRAEPDNLEGWVLLAVAGVVRSDHAAVSRAKRAEIRLDPIDAGS